MKLLAISLVALAMVATPANGQMSCCGPSGMSASAGGLAGLKLVNLSGDTVKLAEHIGMMPMVMLLAGTGAPSGKAADVVQATVSAREEQPMLVYVLAANPKPAKAFAESHKLTGLVLVDPKRSALAAARADSLPVVLFIGKSGNVASTELNVSEATVNEGMKAIAQTEEKLVDPVCGMTVTKETAAGSYTYNGKTYYFCSKACKENFTKDPQKYLQD